MPRVLLLSMTTGYQARSFHDAAAKLGMDLVLGRDHCRALDDPWGDRALTLKFHDDPRSLETIVRAAERAPLDGVLAVGDQPAALAARAAAALGLPFHPPDAALASGNKLATRERLAAAGLPVPFFERVTLEVDPWALAARVPYPCVIKPMALSGSRGVIRADDPASFVAAFERIKRILREPDVRVRRDAPRDAVLVESFIEGTEFAVEGLMTRGAFRALAIFDKPDPLDGPFFEETIYVTPSRQPAVIQDRIVEAVAGAARAIGLWHGPVHAECRVNPSGVFVLEAAPRPIGGLCARALRMVAADGSVISFEELLLRHASGESVEGCPREPDASGVMMIPIPRAGVYRGVDGIEAARSVPGVDGLIITAVPDQLLVPLPEGASYLGFIFARAGRSDDVEAALRDAHARLSFRIDRQVPVAR